MRVLIACEFSGTVRKAFARRGHDAWSCDLLPAEDANSMLGRHYTGNVLDILYEPWDMLIAFPPCFDLAVSGARWFPEKRKNGSQKASIDFFMRFADHPCPRKGIENPIGIMSTIYRKPDQIVQPWQFGHGETKATCLWLTGLPLLQATNVVAGREQRILRMAPSPDRAHLRSITYLGIAEAMAEQWGNE
jgi:hypothetical protein